MSVEESGYLSYLMRLWQDSDDDTHRSEGRSLDPKEGQAAWRVSLESARTGKRRSFANLEDLLAFLQQQTGAVSDADDDETAEQCRYDSRSQRIRIP